LAALGSLEATVGDGGQLMFRHPRRWLLGLVLSGLVLGSPFLWKKGREARARSLAGQAETAMGAGDRRTAHERLRAAVRLAPNDTRVVRAMARYDFLQRDPRSLSLWIRLVERNRNSAQDWEGLIQSALQAGDRVLAYRALEGFRKAAPNETRKFKRYQSRILLAWEKNAAAAGVAASLVREGGEDPAYLLFAHELMLQGSAAQQKEALLWLWQKARETDQGALSAQIILARAPGLTPAEIKNLIELLRTHPQSGWEARVLAEALEIQQGGRGPAPAAWKQFAQGLETRDRHRTARWLTSVGRAGDAVGMVGEAEARKDRDVFFTYLDILGAEGKWGDMLVLLEDRPAFLPETLHQAYRTRAAEKLGRKDLEEQYWRLALAAARRDSQALIHLANYAAVIGWKERSRELCREMAALPATELQGLTGLLNWARRSRDPVAEKEVLKRLQKKAPALFPSAPGTGSMP
jgi:hypothetical protein